MMNSEKKEDIFFTGERERKKEGFSSNFSITHIQKKE